MYVPCCIILYLGHKMTGELLEDGRNYITELSKPSGLRKPAVKSLLLKHFYFHHSFRQLLRALN